MHAHAARAVAHGSGAHAAASRAHLHGLGDQALAREVQVDALRLLDEGHAAPLIAQQVAQVPAGGAAAAANERDGLSAAGICALACCWRVRAGQQVAAPRMRGCAPCWLQAAGCRGRARPRARARVPNLLDVLLQRLPLRRVRDERGAAPGGHVLQERVGRGAGQPVLAQQPPAAARDHGPSPACCSTRAAARRCPRRAREWARGPHGRWGSREQGGGGLACRVGWGWRVCQRLRVVPLGSVGRRCSGAGLGWGG